MLSNVLVWYWRTLSNRIRSTNAIHVLSNMGRETIHRKLANNRLVCTVHAPFRQFSAIFSAHICLFACVRSLRWERAYWLQWPLRLLCCLQPACFIHHRALYLYEYATGIVLKSRSRASNVYAVFMLCRHDSVLRRVALRVHGNAIVVRVACVSAKYKCVQ